MADKTGFLEEAPGVKSSTRLTIMWTMALASAVVGTICYYVIHTPDPKKDVLEMMGGILLTLVVKVVAAIVNKVRADAQ